MSAKLPLNKYDGEPDHTTDDGNFTAPGLYTVSVMDVINGEENSAWVHVEGSVLVECPPGEESVDVYFHLISF